MNLRAFVVEPDQPAFCWEAFFVVQRRKGLACNESLIHHSEIGTVCCLNLQTADEEHHKVTSNRKTKAPQLLLQSASE